MIIEIAVAVLLSVMPMQIDYPPTENSEWKPYEDYRLITDTTSPQYEILKRAEVETNGLLTIDGHIAVALGESWGEIGDRITFTFSDGHSQTVIIADRKQRKHTKNYAGWHGHNGHVIEAIVCTEMLPIECRQSGSVNGIEQLKGEIVKAVRE